MLAYAEGYVSKVRSAHAFPAGQILLPLLFLDAFLDFFEYAITIFSPLWL
jgi:hypothetical protein